MIRGNYLMKLSIEQMISNFKQLFVCYDREVQINSENQIFIDGENIGYSYQDLNIQEVQNKINSYLLTKSANEIFQSPVLTA